MQKISREQSIGIVIVSYGHEEAISGLVEEIRLQKLAGDKVVIVDNHPEHRAAEIAKILKGVDFVLDEKNNGFSAGCNIGAEKVINDVSILFFMNPDTHLLPDALHEIRKGVTTEYAAWMSLLTLPDGTVNSAGNVVHLSGLSWCDGYGVEAGRYQDNVPVSVLSGACMAIRSEIWKEHHGLSERYFLYYEDTDLSTRILLAGNKLGLLPKSHVGHDYDFAKSSTKWLYVERNRYLYIIRTWPWPVLLLMAPLLFLVEIGLWLVSIVQKRFLLRVKSSLLAIKALPWAFSTRRVIQSKRKMNSYDFVASLEPRINTPLLGELNDVKIISQAFIVYKKLALGILRLFVSI